MAKIKVLDIRDPIKIKKIYTNEFNARVDKMVKRSLELPTSYTSNAPQSHLGEATECFIHGFFNASIAIDLLSLSRLIKNLFL